MSETNRSLILLCTKCGTQMPHSVVPVRDVGDHEQLETAHFLRKKNFIDDRPAEDDGYSRSTYARGRQCFGCGRKSIWIELEAQHLERILRLVDKLNDGSETIKEIEQLQKKTSALIKKLKAK